jgi:hypothetical protein
VKLAKKRKIPLFSGWYPHDPDFRKEFNEALRAAVLHAEEHGDVTLITRLLKFVVGDEARRLILRELVKAFPLSYDREIKRLSLLKPQSMARWDGVNQFDAFGIYWAAQKKDVAVQRPRKKSIDYLSDVQVLRRQAKSFEAAGRPADAAALKAEAKKAETKGRRAMRAESLER